MLFFSSAPPACSATRSSPQWQTRPCPPGSLTPPPPMRLVPFRVLQGAGAILPGLHESGTPAREGAAPPEDAAGLSEVYRDSDGGAGDSSRVVPAARVSERGAGGVEEREEWENADDRMEASLRGCVSLTSLDVSSPRVTAGFIKRWEGAFVSCPRIFCCHPFRR